MYLTKDFNIGLGSEVRLSWRSRNTDSFSQLYLDISTKYHAVMGHNSSMFLLPVMKFQKEFRLVTVIMVIKISNRFEVQGSVLHDVKGINLACYVHLHNFFCWNVQNNINKQGHNIKNRLKLFNNTHIFDPYISVIPITVLSGWKLNCDRLILFWKHQGQGRHLRQVSEQDQSVTIQLPPAEDGDGYHRNIRIKNVSVVE